MYSHVLDACALVQFLHSPFENSWIWGRKSCTPLSPKTRARGKPISDSDWSHQTTITRITKLDITPRIKQDVYLIILILITASYMESRLFHVNTASGLAVSVVFWLPGMSRMNKLLPVAIVLEWASTSIILGMRSYYCWSKWHWWQYSKRAERKLDTF